MRSRKALFFTLISFVFVFILISAHKIDFDYQETGKAQSIMSRVNVMNDFIESLEQDAERALYISGLRSIISFNNYIMENNDPIDPDVAFGEIMINGTIGGEEALLMQEQTLPEWQSRVEDIADDLDLALDLEMHDVRVEHDTPWSVRASMVLNYSLDDDRDVASFNRSSTVSASILIVELQDPLYSLNGLGENQIIRAEDAVIGPSDVIQHLSEGTYINSTAAPSFLMRMEGDHGSSPYGIESILNLSLGNVENKSCVDYTYVDLSSPANGSLVDGVSPSYPWFRLDTYHCNLFAVNCT